MFNKKELEAELTPSLEKEKAMTEEEIEKESQRQDEEIQKSVDNHKANVQKGNYFSVDDSFFGRL